MDLEASSTGPTHVISFVFEESLPATERFSCWVTAIALICNDAILDAKNILNADSPEAISYFARIAAGHVFEAAKFMAATSEWDEVVELLGALDSERRADWNTIVDFASGGTTDSIKPFIARARNYVFHYPDLNGKGLKAVTEALERLAPHTATIALGESLSHYRFTFADEVALNVISATDRTEEQAILEKFTERLRDLVLALQRCSEALLAIFFASKGSLMPVEGPNRREDDPSNADATSPNV